MNQAIWPLRLAAYPYAQPLLIGWQIADRSKDVYWIAYETALNLYLLAQDETRPLNDRYRFLLESQERFRNLLAQGDGHLATHLVLIRILLDLGERQAAVGRLENLLREMTWLAEPLHEDLQISINRPFLPPASDFDHRELQSDLGKWLQASVIETLERQRAFSSYFHNDLHLLKKVLENSNHTPEMERRERLVRLRLGMPRPPAGLNRSPRGSDGGPNAAVWDLLA
ncbi:hypothetical protein [Thiocystis violascens]|uniref:Uncharacterized protein n=1 Tax=Thiocystis violascens (strain ATCC 17096 / DSM 198 / 6111) TaxID=765911 RepID=I3Y7F8_THIV6|nr:hypothetical protein [Thiocystis violascens]AFL72926.1 hypothetical protein Thivi_0888 [Thiocystis violascens DSM 198]